MNNRKKKIEIPKYKKKENQFIAFFPTFNNNNTEMNTYTHTHTQIQISL